MCPVPNHRGSVLLSCRGVSGADRGRRAAECGLYRVRLDSRPTRRSRDDSRDHSARVRDRSRARLGCRQPGPRLRTVRWSSDGPGESMLTEVADGRSSPGSALILTGTICSGIPGSATCRAMPPRPAPTLPVRPAIAPRRWRHRAHRVSLWSWSRLSPRCPRGANPCRVRSSPARLIIVGENWTHCKEPLLIACGPSRGAAAFRQDQPDRRARRIDASRRSPAGFSYSTLAWLSGSAADEGVAAWLRPMSRMTPGATPLAARRPAPRRGVRPWPVSPRARRGVRTGGARERRSQLRGWPGVPDQTRRSGRPAAVRAPRGARAALP
jgi:hypothetical protein